MRRINVIAILMSGLILSLPTQAAKPSLPATQDSFVVMALRLPNPQRADALRKQGAKSVARLRQLIFDEKQSLQVRWRALTTLPQLQPLQSQALIEKTMIHKDWFMRNAGLIAMGQASSEKAIAWSKKLLNDPALVVRTAAVQMLEKLHARDSEALLWKKLNAPENFKSGQSLWIRKHIARTLSTFAKHGDEKKMVTLLKDKDTSLHPYAIEALHRLTNTPMSTSKQETLEDRRQAWLSWSEQI